MPLPDIEQAGNWGYGVMNKFYLNSFASPTAALAAGNWDWQGRKAKAERMRLRVPDALLHHVFPFLIGLGAAVRRLNRARAATPPRGTKKIKTRGNGQAVSVSNVFDTATFFARVLVQVCRLCGLLTCGVRFLRLLWG